MPHTCVARCSARVLAVRAARPSGPRTPVSSHTSHTLNRTLCLCLCLCPSVAASLSLSQSNPLLLSHPAPSHPVQRASLPSRRTKRPCENHEVRRARTTQAGRPHHAVCCIARRRKPGLRSGTAGIGPPHRHTRKRGARGVPAPSVELRPKHGLFRGVFLPRVGRLGERLHG